MRDDTDDAPQRTRELLARVQSLAATLCRACGAPLCGHAAVLSIVLGYQSEPRCAACLAAALGEPATQLCERSLQWVLRRECFLRGWLWASAVEGAPGETRPRCTFGAATRTEIPDGVATAGVIPPESDAVWDAGSMGCGDLVLELRNRLRALEPAAVLAVRAEDPAAPIDLPAWCGLTGHTLLCARHPDYWILRRDS
jgi:tRNA 2-thiouridine synthesizing protein A